MDERKEGKKRGGRKGGKKGRKEGKEIDKNSNMCVSSRYWILWVSQSTKSRKLCSLGFTIHGLK